MWIEGHLATKGDWLFGIQRYDGFDPDLDMDHEISYLSFGFGLFSISFCVKKQAD